jgi:S1-C subfamily serine protease
LTDPAEADTVQAMLLPVLLLTLATGPTGTGPAQPVACPVVVVRGGAWTGSGIVWDRAARRVLTALHVVEEMPQDAIEVVVGLAAPVRARVVDREPLLDLALLEVAGPLEAGPPVGTAIALAPGDAIAVAGCPEGRCRRKEGRVLSPARAFAGSRYLAVSAEARPGASGGAVLDARGAVVGIVDLTLLREPGVALAIPIERAAARFPSSGVVAPAERGPQ